MVSRAKSGYNKTEVRITRAVIALPVFTLIFFITYWFSHNKMLLARHDPWIPAALFFVFAALSALLLYLHFKKRKEDVGLKVFESGFFAFFTLTLSVIFLTLWATMPVDNWAYTVPILYIAVISVYVLYITVFSYTLDFKFFGIETLSLGLIGYLVYLLHFHRFSQVLLASQPSKLFTFLPAYLLSGGVILFLLYNKKKQIFADKKRSLSFGLWKSVVPAVLSLLYLILLQNKVAPSNILLYVFGGCLALWFVLVMILRSLKLVK